MEGQQESVRREQVSQEVLKQCQASLTNEQAKLAALEGEMAKSVGETAEVHEKQMAVLQKEVGVVQLQLEAALGEAARAESALREALEGSATELAVREKVRGGRWWWFWWWFWW